MNLRDFISAPAAALPSHRFTWCRLRLALVFLCLPLAGLAQSITAPADGFEITVARGGTVATTIGVSGGNVVASESSDAAIATVTHTANAVTVTGVGNGTATVTYAVTGGDARTLVVSVVDPYVVLPSALFANDVVLGRSPTFELQTFSRGGVLAGTSVSSAPSVATVVDLDATSLRVTGAALGTADITLTVNVHGTTLTHTFPVNVRHPYVSSPAEAAVYELPVGGNASINVFTVPNGGVVASASAADPAIASVGFSGRKLLLTGLAAGTTTISYATAIDGHTATNTLALSVTAATGTAQTITFPGVGSTQVGTHVSLAASSDAVPAYLLSYVILSGSGVLSGASYTPGGAGTHMLRAYHNGTDTIAPAYADMTFTALGGQIAPTIAWEAGAPLPYGTALGVAQLNAQAIGPQGQLVPGTFVYTPAAGTLLGLGDDQPLNVAFTPADAVTYSAATATAMISVVSAMADPGLAWSTPAAIAYGTPLGAVQLNATASAPGTFVYSPAAGTVLNAGSDQTLSVTFTPTDTATYRSETLATTLTVGKATPVLTWAAPSPISYGTPLGATQLAATADVPGTFAYVPAAGTVLNAGGDQTLGVTFTPTDAANYNSATASTTIDVNSSAAGLTWDTPAAIIYGTPLDVSQLNATASVPGTFVYSPAAGTILGAGEHELSVTFTPTDAANYSPSTLTVPLEVNRAPLLVTANDAARPAGTENPAFAASYSGFVNDDTAAVISGLALSTSATAASPAGEYPIVPSGGSAENYTISYIDGTLTVSPAVQTVTLATGSLAVTAGDTGSLSATTAATLVFTASGGSTGSYTWSIDGTPQSVANNTLTTSFFSASLHTVSVVAAAHGGHAASEAATIEVTVSTGEFWTVAAGPNHTLALKGDGTVWAWGRNDSGQLGDGTTLDRLVAPAAVNGMADAIAIAAGDHHSLAIRADGTVWAWGRNDTGQLGIASTTGQTAPVPVTALAGAFVQIAAGAGHAVALRSDGTVWTWGANGVGQLGDGTATQRNTPVQAAGLTDIVALASGARHSLALKGDGSVWAWGANGAGQLGDGTTADRFAPVEVIGLDAEILGIAAGASHTLALASDGAVWSWGGNGSGQLGDGTTTPRSAPAEIGGLGDIVGLASGGAHSVAVKNNGTVWTWGGNTAGQLGDGSTAQRLVPAEVSGLTDAIEAAAGGDRTVVVSLDGTLHVLGGAPDHAGHPGWRIVRVPLRLVPSGEDTDQDGMADAVEVVHFGDLSHTGADDSDGDRLTDAQELYLGSDPLDPYDHEPEPVLSVVGGDHQAGFVDEFNAEPFDIAVWSSDGTRPLVNAEVTFTVASGGGLLATTNLGTPSLVTSLTRVTDVDGTAQAYYRQPSTAYVTSQVTVVAGGSQLLLASLSTDASDADGNRLPDTWEEQYFGAGHPPLDPNADPDGDGLTNLQEFGIGSSPVDPDSDNDGMNDGEEYDSGRNPTDATDSQPLPQAYQLIMKSPDEYLGVKPNWGVTPVTVP